MTPPEQQHHHLETSSTASAAKATAVIERPAAEVSTEGIKPGKDCVPLLWGFLRNKFFHALTLFCIVNAFAGVIFAPSFKTVESQFSESDLRQTPEKSVRKPWPWWLARGFLACSPKPDIVVFGSSQMGSAQATADAKQLGEWIDVVTHRRIVFLEEQIRKQGGAPATVLSLAVPGAVISDEYLMSKALLHDHPPKTVVLTVAPRDFIDATLPSPSATDQFKFFSKYVQLEKLAGAAYPDAFARLDSIVKKIPLSRIGTEIQSAFKATQPADSRNARDIVQAITSVASDPAPGQWVVPPTMPELWTDNTVEYKHRFKGPDMNSYSRQMQFFEQWLDDLNGMKVNIVIVAMPSMNMNRSLLPSMFWDKFRSDLKRSSTRVHGQFIDLSDDSGFEKNDYLDTVHLNAHGAEKLFPKIAAGILRTGVQ